MKIDKKTLVNTIVDSLTKELNQSVEAANNAHLAATDDQSVAETQYDTLAIEAAYLAEGQTRRVNEIKEAIARYQHLPLRTFDERMPIALGALVQLAKDEGKQHYYFIGPAAGGFKTCNVDQHITVITPQSPLGNKLIGKYIDDDILLLLGDKMSNNSIDDYILAIM